MIKFLSKHKYLVLTFIISFLIFYPSLFVFFTNDDFFFLKVSKANNIFEFFNFFSLLKGPEGFGMYRPLTTQVFYFLTAKFFNLSPFPLHVISFIFFFGIIYLVYKLIKELIGNERIALLSAFLYAVSATHFGQLYYLAAFQELGMTFFALLSCLFFIRKKNVLAFLFFVLSLLSKETAIVIPGLFFIIYIFRRGIGKKTISLKRLILSFVPYIVTIGFYMYVRFVSYGFATGDSYVWDFSIRKLINTTGWYLLWSFNIPESLVDFVGSGLKINPNLFVFWGEQIKPILILFIVQAVLFIYVLMKLILNRERGEKDRRENSLVSLFCLVWFLISLLPVIFLPLHKFTFYLTLPLIGVVFRISYLLDETKINKFITGIFLVLWTTTSVLTLRFTYDTNWISQSSLISQRVFKFLEENKNEYQGKKIVFVDTKDDETLPWSPTSVVRTVLSDKNFFDVFHPNLSDNVFYKKDDLSSNSITVMSRQFLGY